MHRWFLGILLFLVFVRGLFGNMNILAYAHMFVVRFVILIVYFYILALILQSVYK